ncbi:hypothetical protein GCM10010415_16240 [Streptomyces atrovirens]
MGEGAGRLGRDAGGFLMHGIQSDGSHLSPCVITEARTVTVGDASEAVGIVGAGEAKRARCLHRALCPAAAQRLEKSALPPVLTAWGLGC